MIVITTPTGQIGSQVLASLLPSQEDLRVVVRDPDRLDAEVRDRVEVTSVHSIRDFDIGADPLWQVRHYCRL